VRFSHLCCLENIKCEVVGQVQVDGNRYSSGNFLTKYKYMAVYSNTVLILM